LAPASRVVPLPPGISFERAAAVLPETILPT
jgi:NADPH:quinone reductase-like Zn-dependent oxidoreductase